MYHKVYFGRVTVSGDARDTSPTKLYTIPALGRDRDTHYTANSTGYIGGERGVGGVNKQIKQQTTELNSRGRVHEQRVDACPCVVLDLQALDNVRGKVGKEFWIQLHYRWQRHRKS